MMVYTYDSNGLYVSQSYEDAGYNLTTSQTTVPLDFTKFVEPKFDSTTNEWVEGKTPEELFGICQQAKIAQLSAACNAAITSGFSSSALGTAHTYPCDEEAQRNFHTEILNFLIDPTYTTSMFKTIDAGYLPHTKDQLIQVFKDGKTTGFNYIQKYNKLKADVLAVTYTTTTTSTTTTNDFTSAESQVNSISWS